MTIKPVTRDGFVPKWTKSSYSSNEHGSDCVEVAVIPGAVRVRDSKDPHGPQLALSPDVWAGFVAYAARR